MNAIPKQRNRTKAYGSTVARIISALEIYGPMTRSEICQHLELDRMNCSSVITRLARPNAKGVKRIHVSGYTHDSESLRYYPRAIYAAGDKPDAKKMNRQENKREVRRRTNRNLVFRNTANFVFNLAKTRREYA